MTLGNEFNTSYRAFRFTTDFLEPSANASTLNSCVSRQQIFPDIAGIVRY